MGLSKSLIYLAFKCVSIGFTLLILKYKYWLNVVNPHFPDETPFINKPNFKQKEQLNFISVALFMKKIL